MPNAARMTDKMKQQTPHCHAPIHPSGPVPTPVAHPGQDLTIVSVCIPTVMTEGQQQAVIGSMSTPCILPSCVPAGPGLVSKGSGKVMVLNMPAARVDDMTAHASCVAPIPSPTGMIQSPGASNVKMEG